jgi:thioester reductase-like protein
MTLTNDFSQRIADLSPEQRSLLVQHLKQQVGIVYRPGASAEGFADGLDLAREAELDPSLDPLAVPGQFITNPRTVFLTGGTGFLGAFVIAELLKQTQTVIYCLVRAKDAANGHQRLKQNLVSYDIWQAEFSNRIIPILGDLESSRFGLEQTQFDELAEQIDVIYHCAASLNFVFPYAALKPQNVTATEDVIRLACTVKRKTVHYMSSVSVFESHAYAGKVIYETDPLEHHSGMFLGYAQSKWVAEKMMLQARDRGLPVCIYRLPFISGDSNTGAWNTSDFTCLLIRGCMEMGTAPVLDYWINSCPVNYASTAIAYLSAQPASEGQVFHLMNPNPITSEQANTWDSELGSPVKQIAFSDWIAQLEAEVTSTDHPLFSLRSFFLEPFTEEKLTIPELYTRDRTPEFDCTATLQALGGSGIVCHPINPILYGTYFDYFLRKQMLDASSYAPGVIRSFRWKFGLYRFTQRLPRALQTLRQGFDFARWQRINIALPQAD